MDDGGRRAAGGDRPHGRAGSDALPGGDNDLPAATAASATVIELRLREWRDRFTNRALWWHYETQAVLDTLNLANWHALESVTYEGDMGARTFAYENALDARTANMEATRDDS